MRLLLVGNDSGGHLSSMVGFARLLKERGHQPFVLSAPSARGIVEEAGAEAVPVRAPEEFGIASVLGRALREGGPPFAERLPPRLRGPRLATFVTRRERELLFRRVLPRVVETTAREVERAARDVGASAVVSDALTFGGPYGAKMAGVPSIGLATDPAFTLDDRGVPFLLPHLACRKVPGPVWRRVVDAALPLREVRARLGIAPQGFTAELYASCISDELHVVIAPPGFNGAPPAPGHRFVGPLVVPSLDVRTVDVDVDERTVLVTGSTTGHPRGVAALRRTVEALAETSLRVVVAAGRLNGYAPRVGANVTLIDGFVRHDDLVPRAGVVVTHGGWGVVARALRAGTPLVVTPAFGPQDFVGQRVHALGLGIEVALDAITPDVLERACRQAMTDEAIRRATTEMKARLATLDTPALAVAAIEDAVAGRAAA